MSAGVAARPLVERDLFHSRLRRSSGGNVRHLLLAQTVAAGLETGAIEIRHPELLGDRPSAMPTVSRLTPRGWHQASL